VRRRGKAGDHDLSPRKRGGKGGGIRGKTEKGRPSYGLREGGGTLVMKGRVDFGPVTNITTSLGDQTKTQTSASPPRVPAEKLRRRPS